jgi:hypothetical protein
VTVAVGSKVGEVCCPFGGGGGGPLFLTPVNTAVGSNVGVVTVTVAVGAKVGEFGCPLGGGGGGEFLGGGGGAKAFKEASISSL